YSPRRAVAVPWGWRQTSRTLPRATGAARGADLLGGVMFETGCWPRVSGLRWRLLMAVVLAVIASGWAAASSRAIDYSDANGNVCEGNGCYNANLVANGAYFNTAFGDHMMNALTSGFSNIAIGSDALSSDQ